MNRSYLIIVLMAAFSVLSSCSTSYRGFSPDSVRERGLKSNEGWIVGGFSTKQTGAIPYYGGLISASHLRAKGTSAGAAEDVMIDNQWKSHSDALSDLAPGPIGPCFAIPVPAGTYELYDWTVSSVGPGGASIRFQCRSPFKVPFTVEPGKATYIGRMEVAARGGRNLLGMPVLSDAMVLLTDQPAQDIPSITSHFKTIPGKHIRRANLAPAYAGEMQRVAAAPHPWWSRF